VYIWGEGGYFITEPFSTYWYGGYSLHEFVHHTTPIILASKIHEVAYGEGKSHFLSEIIGNRRVRMTLILSSTENSQQFQHVSLAFQKFSFGSQWVTVNLIWQNVIPDIFSNTVSVPDGMPGFFPYKCKAMRLFLKMNMKT